MSTDNNSSVNNVVKEEDDSQFEQICKQIGEMSLKEGVKFVWSFLLGLKLKHIAMGLMWLIIIIFGGYAVFGYLFPFALKLIWKILSCCVSMSLGIRDYALDYCFFDRDLLLTMPLCIVVAIVVGRSFSSRSFLYAIMYFVMLVSVLETWDYWFTMKIGFMSLWGGVCFVVMFIIIPILMWVRKP